MSARRIWRFVAVVGAVTLAGAGCSSGSSEEDFQDELAEICEEADDRGDELDEDFDAAIEDEDVDEIHDIAEEGLDLNEEVSNDLEDLNPPSDDEDALEELQDAQERSREVIEELTEIEEIDELNDLAEDIEEINEQQDEAAEDLDVDQCATDEGGGDDSTDDSTDSTDDGGDSTDDGGDIAVGDPIPPEDFIIDYGADAQFDGLADDCFDSDFDACDELFAITPVGTDYESYAQTCGGRVIEGDVPSGSCEDALG